jgi:putative ABC transport system ATP-binding protein
MIALRHVTMRLSAGGRALTILDDITIEIPPKQFVAVVGPSGSGKSTLLAVIAGLEAPTVGMVALDGIALNGFSEDAVAGLRLDKVGIVFQAFHLVPTLTALENVAVPLELAGESDPLGRALARLDEVGLRDRAHHYPVQLSGGEQQRVALARACARRPPILLADEPTGNLDTATGAQVIALLRRLHQESGNTLVLVTHDASLTASADRVITLRDGRVVDDTGHGARR